MAEVSPVLYDQGVLTEEERGCVAVDVSASLPEVVKDHEWCCASHVAPAGAYVWQSEIVPVNAHEKVAEYPGTDIEWKRKERRGRPYWQGPCETGSEGKSVEGVQSIHLFLDFIEFALIEFALEVALVHGRQSRPS